MKRSPMEVSVTELVAAAGLADAFSAATEAGAPFHLAIENEPYMRLVVEVVAVGEVSVAHYYQQHGDAMRDPEIVFRLPRWLPVEITQDPMGRHHRADAGYYLSGVQELARMWAGNIRHQGFAKRGTFSSATHEIKGAM